MHKSIKNFLISVKKKFKDISAIIEGLSQHSYFQKTPQTYIQSLDKIHSLYFIYENWSFPDSIYFIRFIPLL